MWGSLSWPGWLTDSSPLCLCVSMGNGAVSRSQKALGPSISVRGCGGEGVCGMCHLKTNGQEVQPEKQQYLRNINSERCFGSGDVTSMISTGTRAGILIDEPAYVRCSIHG